MADRVQLVDLGEHRRQAHVAGAGLDRAELVLGLNSALRRVVVDVRLGARVEQRLDARDVPRVQASNDRRDEDRVSLADRGVNDPAGSLRRGRLDPVVLAAREQHRSDVLGPPLVLGDVGRQPARELLAVADGADPKPRVDADLAAMVLDLAAREVIGADLRRGDLDLPREMLDRVVGQLEQTTGKAALVAHVLEHRREPQPRGPRLVAQQLAFAIIEREVLDDIVKADLAAP